MRKTSRYKYKYGGKKRTIIKKKIISIEETVDGGGIYCFLPYDSSDLSGSGLFKVVITNDIKKNF
jgi:hypothetical protein